MHKDSHTLYQNNTMQSVKIIYADYFLIICIIIVCYSWCLNFLGIKGRVGSWIPRL